MSLKYINNNYNSFFIFENVNYYLFNIKLNINLNFNFFQINFLTY